LRLADALDLGGADEDARCAAVDRLTRTEAARLVLAGERVRLLERLRQKHRVQVIAFDRQAWDVGPDGVNDVLQPGPKATADSATTRRAPLARALDRSGGHPGRALGVVLLTDGRHTWGEPPGDLAQTLGAGGVPVFPVALGARQPPPDVGVVEVLAPANVFRDGDAEVHARVRVSSLPAQELVAELL